MFKSLHVLCITVYQRIQCDCSWRWASFRNGVWSVETDGCYRLGCVGEYTVKKGKTIDKRHDGNIWNTYGYKTVWRTWAERLIRWGALYCAEEWDFRLLRVKCQCNLLFLGKEKKKVVPLWKLSLNWENSLWSPAPSVQLRALLGWQVTARALTSFTQAAEQAIGKVTGISRFENHLILLFMT